MLQDLVGRLRASMNPRTTLLVKAMAVVLAFVLVLELSDAADAAVTQARSDFARLETVRSADVEQDWQNRAEAAQSLATEWQAGQWRADTVGLAAANMQTRLRQLSGRNGFRAAAARVTPEPIAAGDQQTLRFDVSGNGSAISIVDMLAAISLSEPRLVMTRINLRINTRRSSVRVSGAAPIELPRPDNEGA